MTRERGQRVMSYTGRRRNAAAATDAYPAPSGDGLRGADAPLPFARLRQASAPQGGDIGEDARPYIKQTPKCETWFTAYRPGSSQLFPGLGSLGMI